MKTSLHPIPLLNRSSFRTYGGLVLALLSLVLVTSVRAQKIQVAGQLLIDVNASRGTLTGTGISTVAGETNLITWTNYGTLGGEFDMVNNSAYAATIGTAYTNPPKVITVTAGSISALAPESPSGSRLMVANFLTPAQLQGSSHYTVECWFDNIGSTANPRGVFAWTTIAPAAGTDGGELAAASTGSDHFDGNSLNWSSSGTTPSTATWHYGVITYDGITEKAYLDGVLTDSAVRALNIDAELANPVLFSQLNAIPATATSSSFNGAIAAVRVHTEALAASDVVSNYTAGISAVPAAPTNSIYTDSSAATAVLGTTATLNGTLTATTSLPTTQLTFFYDTTDDGDATNAWPHSAVATTPGSAPGAFSANISGLTIGTTYYVRIYAVNSGATNMSSFVTSFTTQGKPVLSGGGAFFVSPGSDTLTANLINDGTGGAGATVTLYYGSTDGGTTPANWANTVTVGTVNNGVVSGTVSGLTTLGNYYFTFAAQNTYGTTFVTPSRAFQEGVIFSLNTTNLPAASLPPAALTPVTSWLSSAGAFVPGSGALVHDLGGVQYADFTSANNLYLPVASFPGGAPSSLAINGASLVAVLDPTGVNPEAGNTGGTIITTVFDTQFGIGFGGGINVPISGGSVLKVAITSGGSGYSSANPPAVTISGPGGMSANTTATGTAQVSSAGVVTNVLITAGGSGYAWQRVGLPQNVPVPTVTFAAGTTTATATAVMGTNNNGFQIETVVNQGRPSDTATTSSISAGGDGYNWADLTYGRSRGNDVYIPENQISVVSVVAGSGLNGVGQPTPGGATDNNYLVYVNGVLVEDTAAGLVTSLTLSTTTNGAGYLPLGGNIPLSFNTPPGGTPATGFMSVSTSTNIPGHIKSVTLTSGGSGYTAANPPVLTIPNPTDPNNPQTNVLITFAYQSLGNYLPYDDGGASALDGASLAGWNGGGMNLLEYNLAPGTYGSGNANSTFGVGDEAGTGEIGYIGYMGDVTVYGEAISPAQRQAVENAEGTRFITAATQSFSVGTSLNGAAGSANITAPSTVIQGYNAVVTVTANPGYAITGVTVNGSTVTLVNGSYTISNVSAAQSVIVTTLAVPQQNVTVTYATGGTVLTNGAIIPSGTTTSVGGGSSQTYIVDAGAGHLIGAITVDGVTVPTAHTFAFNNIGVPLSGGTNHTVNVTFTTLAVSPVSAYVPESQSLFFSVDTSMLPQTPGGGAAITNWPMYYSDQGSNQLFLGTLYYGAGNVPAANTYQDPNGVIWEQNSQGANNFYQFYTGYSTTANVIPNTGATIMTVVSPIRGNGSSQPWAPVVDAFFNCFELSVLPDSGLIQAMVDNDNGNYDGTASAIATSTYAIPSGTNVVLSLVAQPNGNFAVYANTVEVITNVGLGSLVLRSYFQNFQFSSEIILGNDGPDGGANFNGLIGNTYFWTTALTTAERTNLEVALMHQFHAVVPPNYNWIGANNGNWSDPNNWSNTIPLAFNTVPGTSTGQTAAFSLNTAVPTPGLGVNLDAPETVFALSFNSSTVISSAAGNLLTLGDGAAVGQITLTGAASPTLNVQISSPGLELNGNGMLTLTTNMDLSEFVTGDLFIAEFTNSTVNVVQTGGTISIYPLAQSWSSSVYNGPAAGVPTQGGPGVMLGGGDDSATVATYSLNGGVLSTPNIGCVTEPGNYFTPAPPVPLVPPSTYGATAILYLNGGILQAADNDSGDPLVTGEGSGHLIFNTTHTWVGAGGAKIDTQTFSDSIAVPLEHLSGGAAIDGGLTKMGAGTLTLLDYSTYTGPTKIVAGILACETTNALGANSVDITTGAKLELDFTGTTPVYQLTLNGGAPLAVGTYGATGSGATHVNDSAFVGTGTLTVLGQVTVGQAPKFTSTVASAGNLVLQGTGGVAGGAFTILGTTNVSLPLSQWTTVGTGNFTASGFSVTVPISTTVPQKFITLVVP